ncbi:hypothetical protein PF005_g12600 [Phytophthora fragariae]|uniref:Uncharacterized protein n=1 Tax=Phytophthora fragariae TaxID=53985 RepID=A0A6A3TR95_9STRA|nr:hypothetical protein PF003_g33745 [Phytophthora fragariae]KAE9141792.1 hypothetical protein PF006_g13049 [Phytophthora fragariae]KAE9207462.1 hypothetical protein PF005_g12600 [Phytophthora fragariae]KAE9222224.1 hypothetical protein PF002_g15343 [Phytophthora fragariae]
MSRSSSTDVEDAGDEDLVPWGCCCQSWPSLRTQQALVRGTTNEY